MSTEEGRKRAIQELANDVHDECGWLSDAQHAQLEWDASICAVRFCGEGSIDVGHMVAIVQDAHRTQAPAPDLRALIDEAREVDGYESSFGLNGLVAKLADALEAALGVNGR